jgi:hypothetical protein
MTASGLHRQYARPNASLISSHAPGTSLKPRPCNLSEPRITASSLAVARGFTDICSLGCRSCQLGQYLRERGNCVYPEHGMVGPTRVRNAAWPVGFADRGVVQSRTTRSPPAFMG